MKLKVQTLDAKGKGDIELSDDVFGIEPRADILHRVVTWQLEKARGTARGARERGISVGAVARRVGEVRALVRELGRERDEDLPLPGLRPGDSPRDSAHGRLAGGGRRARDRAPSALAHAVLEGTLDAMASDRLADRIAPGPHRNWFLLLGCHR